MRRNIVKANYEGWRIYANSQVPVTKLSPDLDFNADVRQVCNYSALVMGLFNLLITFARILFLPFVIFKYFLTADAKLSKAFG